MASTVDAILGLSEDERSRIFASLSGPERLALVTDIELALSNPYTRWADDPIGFVEVVLGETLWSRQKDILLSIRDHKRTTVPACHAPGKSHIAARAIAWWVSVHPPGTATVVTTATTFRQVRNILWPHIRRLHDRHNLAGEVFTTDWKIGSEIVAYGFSSQNQDEAAVQGVHAPHLLVVVDEAGGIKASLGTALESLMTGGHTRLLILGNPPVDNEGSWFERTCTSDLYNVIRIDALSTPNFTGEDAGVCHACPSGVAAHNVTEHLVDATWVKEVKDEFGDDSAFVEARVHARFPRVTTNKVISLSWCEEAQHNESPDESNDIRLGVDIAADGGDEFVIAKASGYRVAITHRSSGSANANPMDVAGVILGHIRAAEDIHREAGNRTPVRVKIDSIGVGWGIVGILKSWGAEGKHGAVIVGVNVAERAGMPGKFNSQRAEMWWNGRQLLQPIEGRQSLRLDVDNRTLAQLSAPIYKSDSAGRIAIESKDSMKKRGVSSPDRAEAVLLAVYEPPGSMTSLEMPVSLGQTNPWSL
jgi:hypothetical protein